MSLAKVLGLYVERGGNFFSQNPSSMLAEVKEVESRVEQCQYSGLALREGEKRGRRKDSGQ